MADSNKLKYYCDERTIANGESELPVLKSGLTNIKSVLIRNLNTNITHSITVKLNDSSNSAITIQGGKTLAINDEGIIDNIYISNSSGSTVSFSFFMIGG